MSGSGRSDDPPRFSTGRIDPHGRRLLPVCCPAPSLTFGTTIRISRLRYPSCLSRRVFDLWLLRTVGDRWCPPMPELDRCDTDPARTGCPAPSGRGRLLVLRSSATRDRSAGRARKANPRRGAPRAWEALSAGEGGTGRPGLFVTVATLPVDGTHDDGTKPPQMYR